MIIAVGFKVNNQRAVRFRVWANQIVEQYTIKGWAMDEERLKNGGTVLTKKYFEEQLERIREIRISERNFYQKLTDIYATSLDYDCNALTTKEFFAKVQNKMHYAVHRHTAAELIYERADAEKPHMGLHTWKDVMAQDLTKGNPFSVILKFSLPVIGGNLFQLFYTLADTVIVGRTLGADALAAVGSTAIVIYLVLCFI